MSIVVVMASLILLTTIVSIGCAYWLGLMQGRIEGRLAAETEAQNFPWEEQKADDYGEETAEDDSKNISTASVGGVHTGEAPTAPKASPSFDTTGEDDWGDSGV